MFRFVALFALPMFLLACGSSTNNNVSSETPVSAKTKSKLGSAAGGQAPQAMAFLRLMGREGGIPIPDDLDIEHLNATTTFEAETDPRTLLPWHTKRTKTTEIVVKGQNEARGRSRRNV